MRVFGILSVMILSALGFFAYQHYNNVLLQESAYGCDVDISYRPQNNTLVLINPANADEPLAVLENNFNFAYVNSLGLSPNCRYIAAAVGENAEETAAIIWDLARSGVRSLHPYRRSESDSFRNLQWIQTDFAIVHHQDSSIFLTLTNEDQVGIHPAY